MKIQLRGPSVTEENIGLTEAVSRASCLVVGGWLCVSFAECARDCVERRGIYGNIWGNRGGIPAKSWGKQGGDTHPRYNGHQDTKTPFS